MKRVLIWFIFLLLLFVISYYRELIFPSINALIRGDEFFYSKTTSLPFLQDWSPAELVRLKYFLTLFFTIIFMVLTSFGLKTSFKENTAFTISIAIYALLILLGALIAMIGLPLSGFAKTYPYLRMIIGWIHSPLLYLFITIGVLAYDQLSPKKSSS